MVVLASCQGDSFHPSAALSPDQVYWALELNHHAVTLSISPSAPGKDTLTLIATARTIDGKPLDVPPVQYVSQDPDRIIVTPDGVLRALQTTPSGQPVTVVATLTADNLKHIDSVIVVAVDEPAPPVLDSFSIHPGPTDSAKAAIGIPTTCFALPQTQRSPFCRIILPVTLLDEAGTPIPSAAVAIRSADPHMLRITSNGVISLLDGTDRPGTVSLFASATVFGISRADTLPFRVGWPASALISFPTNSVTRESWGPVFTIGAGGTLVWNTGGSDTVNTSIDITFTDPTNVVAADLSQPHLWLFTALACSSYPCSNGSGNIVLDGSTVPIIGSSYVFRRFPVPGVYDYHSTALGVSGRVVVMDER